ncbi:MAG: putative Regulatory-associated protein of TOR 1, partial [Streblomastix strix]
MAAQHTRFFCSLRHERSGIPQQAEQIEMPKIIQTNTTHIIIAICLGKDITPPGTLPLKHKCAHKECWLDITRTTKKEDDKLVNNLYKQYDHWWKEQREKQILELLDLPIDPTDKQLKEQCENARESAKNHRVFFHYNGRGVIQPYPQYLYVFDERHTNYTPITLKDLSSRLQTPSVYIFDCSNAGDMISMDSPLCIDGNVVLAACSSRETLPQNGDVPFDIFTSCLTTPVVMAALRFIRRTRNFSMQHTEALLEQLRNEQDCKSSIAYNLNWILTTITDTIAYNSFPKQIFLGLFRDDNLLANTMRHFMLAQRVLRLWGCNPVSFPPLPPTHSHPLWNTFDLALDVALKKMSRQNQFHPQMQMQMQMQLFPYSLPDLQYKQIRFPMSPKGIQPKLNLLFAPSPSLSNQLFVSLVFTHNEIPPISLSDKFNQIEIQQQDKNNYQLFINQHNDELKQQQQQEMSIIDYKSGLAQSTTSTQHFIDQEDGEDELQFFYEHFNSFEEWLRLGPLEGSPPVYLPIVLHGLQNRQLRLRSVQLLEQFISLGERALRQAMHAGALLMCLRLFSTKGDIHYHIPSIWARILA